jgi:hypothetical protein
LIVSWQVGEAKKVYSSKDPLGAVSALVHRFGH